MPGRGLQDIPIRPPEEWSASWYLKHIREVLALVDIRNAIEGPGITITGSSSEPATVSATGGIVGLLDVPFVTLSLSSQLTAERILTGESGIVTITDGGAQSSVTVGLQDFGVPLSKLTEQPAFSVLGNQLDDTGPVAPITAANEYDVLWVRDVDGAGTLGMEFSYLRFADGSAAAPGIAFYDDQDTGLYRLGDNNFGMATDGTLRWDLNTARVYQNLPLEVANGVGGVWIINDVKTDCGLFLTSESGNVLRGARSTIEFREHGPSDGIAGFKIMLRGDPDATETNGDLFFYRVIGSSNTYVMRIMKAASQVQYVTGTAGVPPIAFSDGSGPSTSNTGIYQSAANAVNVSTNGVDRWGVGTVGITFSLPQYGGNGSAATPTYSFDSDKDNGMYLPAANQLGFSTSGTVRLTLTTTGITSTLPVGLPAGTSSAPSLTFSADLNTGAYNADPDVFGVVTGGSERFRIGPNGEIGLSGAVYGSAGQVLTSSGSGAAVTWADATGGGGGSLVYVNTSVPAGNTVDNTTSETAFDSDYEIGANQLQPGSVVRLKLYGVFSTDAVAPTIRIRVDLDSTTVLDSGAVTLTAGLTNEGWTLEGVLVCQTDGATGDIEAQGFVEFALSASDGQVVNLANTAPITIDTTTSQTLAVSVEWGAADTDNTITLREMTVDLIDAVTPTAAAPAAATYLTEDDETADLPNSRQLTAGTGITFDDSTPGIREISSSGGGGGWTQLFNYDGSSLADFTTDSGTWAVTGGVFELTTTGAAFGRLRKTARVPQAGIVIEVEIMVASTSRNVATSTAGIIMGWDGAGGGGCVVRLQWNNRNPAANGAIMVETDGSATVTGPVTQTFALDTWVTLRVVRFGQVVDVYFDGTYITSGSFSDVATDETCGFVGLNGFDADDIFYREFTAWGLTLP